MNARVLMSEAEVVALMRASSSKAEWDANSEAVKLLFYGQLPAFWDRAIFASGVAQEVERRWMAERAIATPPVGVPPEDPQLLQARALLANCRLALRIAGVRPLAWVAGLGCELIFMMATQGAESEEAFERRLTEFLRSLQDDVRRSRQRFRGL
jgi:hypothetical protein